MQHKDSVMLSWLYCIISSAIYNQWQWMHVFEVYSISRKHVKKSMFFGLNKMKGLEGETEERTSIRTSGNGPRVSQRSRVMWTAFTRVYPLTFPSWLICLSTWPGWHFHSAAGLKAPHASIQLLHHAARGAQWLLINCSRRVTMWIRLFWSITE